MYIKVIFYALINTGVAGIIYLSLPISREGSYRKNTKENKVQTENTLYRINENNIETSCGTYPIDENTKWLTRGKEVFDGKARFLGQNIRVDQGNGGIVKKIETLADLDIPQRIRVILSADLSGNSYIHSRIAVTCEEEFWSITDGVVQTYPPKTEITQEAFGKRTIFFPAKEGNALTVISPIGIKKYLGTLEVTTETEGYSVINEVSLENYIKGVVPSEMPGSYGEEAAKVQAVCARSYIYSQWISSNKYANWGAQVDDSIKSQVYGGKILHGTSENGVDATWGEILTYNGKPISTHYFSTSCGHTANGNEVWGGNQEEYQKGRTQVTEGEYSNLSNEERFHEFITDHDVKSFDSNSPWFRWSVEIPVEQMQKNLDLYFEESPSVKVVKEDMLLEEKINEMGSISDIFIYDRSETGMALSVLLIGDEKNVSIERPTEIRKLLGNLSVTLMNGETSGNRQLLPSAFIALEKTKDIDGRLVSVKICGGGYGHGVGMSQNGVKGMVDAGYEYREILKHYFPETELTVL